MNYQSKRSFAPGRDLVAYRRTTAPPHHFESSQPYLASLELVVAIVPLHGVIAAGTEHEIVAFATVHEIVVGIAPHVIVVVATIHEVDS